MIVTVMGDDDEDSLLVREREYCLVEGFVMRTTVCVVDGVTVRVRVGVGSS